MNKPTVDLVVSALLKAIKNLLHIDAQAESTLESLHLDYFDAVDLAMNVEDALGDNIKGNVEDYFKDSKKTIQQLAESIVSNL